MKKPLIGITSSVDRSRQPVPYFSLKESYVKAIEMAGGTPLILAVTSSAVMKALTSILDGLVFSGGGDIAPWLFDQEPILGLGSFDTLRDEWEIELCNQAWKARIPMLGICRGCQLMNVARGGSLLQDIKRSNPAALLHNPQIAYDELFHHIAIEKESVLFELFKTERLLVNSFHHQAVDKTASDFRITARSSDGIIEALEPIDPERFALALQFHPEGLFLRYGAFLAPFSALIEATKGSLSATRR